MKRYWLRIMIGALAVFAVGMVIVTFTRRGIVTVHSIVESAEPLSLPLAFVGFKMDGIRAGEIKRVTLLRDAPQVVRAVEVTVDLDRADSAAVPTCFLVVDQLKEMNQSTSFRCGTSADTVEGKYLEFGTVAFRGRGHAVPLFLPRSIVLDLQQHPSDFVPPEQVAPPPPAAAPTAPAAQGSPR